MIMMTSVWRGQKKLTIKTERNDVDTIKIEAMGSGRVFSLVMIQFT